MLTSKDEIYRLVTENATDVVWVMDLSGRYMYFSPSVARLTGYSVEEITANPIRVMTEAGIEYVRRAIDVQLRREKTGQKEVSKPMEMELVRKDGSRVWAETTWSLLRNDDG